MADNVRAVVTPQDLDGVTFVTFEFKGRFMSFSLMVKERHALIDALKTSARRKEAVEVPFMDRVE